MAAKHRRKITEALAVTKLRKETVQAMENMAQYLVGGLEQLGHQLGQVMGAQEAMVTLMEQTDPTVIDKLKAIIEAKQAEAKEAARVKAETAALLATEKGKQKMEELRDEAEALIAVIEADKER